MTQMSEWHIGEGKCIRTPSYENYGHVVLRALWAYDTGEDTIEFTLNDANLPEKYYPAIRSAALHWLSQRRTELGALKTKIIVYDGSWYGTGTMHYEATEFALNEAARQAGLLNK